MDERPLDLPDFEKPPLYEVAFSIQFHELAGYQTVHAGLLWGLFKDQFKQVEEYPPLEPAFETFGRPGQTQFTLNVANRPPVRRLWFITEDLRQLIQFQSDRLIHNWRKVGDNTNSDDYPRYETIKSQFFQEINIVNEFLGRENIGSIVPNQCELSYVNHLIMDDDEDFQHFMSEAFEFVQDISPQADSDPNARLPEAEDVRTMLRFLLRDTEKTPVGRLIVQVEPGFVDDGGKMVRFSLTVRGKPPGESEKDMSAFFDNGRDAIVRGFTRLTTRKMHNLWQRTDKHRRR